MSSGRDEQYRQIRRRAGEVRRRLMARARTTGATSMHPAPVGHAPEVTLEHTNLGPVMDQAVLRAKRRFRLGVDPDYDLLYENFDVLHYLLQVPGLAGDPDVDLIEHFLENGRRERLSPHPDFSMHEYLRRYPDKLARGRMRNPYLYWLKFGKPAGDIADPAPRLERMAPVLGMSAPELADAVAARRRDLQERFRTGRLGEMFAQAAELEPLIGATWSEIAAPHLVPLSRDGVVEETCAIYDAQQAAGFRPARVILVANRPRWGGGRRIEGHLAHALAAHIDPSEIVVIYTDDTGETPAGRFPAGVREIDFATMSARMRQPNALHALIMLLRTFGADAIVNINSALLYRALRPFGRALTATERLFPVFLCDEQTATGTWVGWSLGYFYRTFEEVAGVFTDSGYLADRLLETHRVQEHHRERMHVLRAPVDPSLPMHSESPARPGRRPQVFWAGRWDRQKRIDLALEVARLMPDVDVRMWGEAVLTGHHQLEVPDNVRLEGLYAHITDIDLANADAWLYTSAWDGVPSQLLEVGMTGIPIVGTLVGGTGEVVGGGESWCVAADADAQAYVTAIREVLADPAEARRRAARLRERLLRERDASEFAAHVGDLLLTRRDEERVG